MGPRKLLLLLLALGACSFASANVEFDMSGIFVPAKKILKDAPTNTSQTQEKHFRLKREIAVEVNGTLMVPQNHSTALAPQLIANETLDQINKTAGNVDAPTAIHQNVSATAGVLHVVVNHSHGISLNQVNKAAKHSRNSHAKSCHSHNHHVEKFTTPRSINATGGSTVNIPEAEHTPRKCCNKTGNVTAHNANGTLDNSHNASKHHGRCSRNKTKNVTAHNANGTLDNSRNASKHHGCCSRNKTKKDPEHDHAPKDDASGEDLPQSEGLWPLLILAMPVVVIGTSLLYARCTQWVREKMGRHHRRPFARFIDRITKRGSDPPSDPRGNLLQLKEFDVDDECSL